jgi:hypothetical protein
MASPYHAAVEARVEANVGLGGWKQPPEKIVAEVSEELVDVAGWLKGLDYGSLSYKEQELVDRLEDGACSLWYEAERLRDSLASP